MAFAAAALLSTAATPQAAGRGEAATLERPALQLRQPQRAAVLATAKAGQRFVAVGERGVALWSDDKGRSWHQAQVPVSVTLTAVSFASARSGWAVGHGAVILHTADAGGSWTRQYDGAAADPLLDVNFADAKTGFAVGGYGLLLRTLDGGKTWQSAAQKLANPKSLHLNAVRTRDRSVLIAGEQGTAYLSTDGGDTFSSLTTPYRGSYLAAAFLPSGELALAGLRGNLLVSTGSRTAWTTVKLPTDAGLTALEPASDGEIRIGAQSGQIFVYRPADNTVRELPRRAPPLLATLIDVGDGAWVAGGLRGLDRLEAGPPRPTP